MIEVDVKKFGSLKIEICLGFGAWNLGFNCKGVLCYNLFF